MTSPLVARDLTKDFGRTRALAGVSLHVGEGELVGLLGPNGAGKSTFVKIVCGLTKATSGDASILDQPPGSAGASSKLGYLAELFRFPPWLSADELLSIHQRLAGSEGGEDERRRLLELVDLDEVAERRVGAMSKGMQQRLGIAQALVGEPRVLILDEPTSALDPVGRRVVRELLIELKQRGTAILLNSHLLGEVERVCDRFVIIKRGEIVAEGTSHELQQARGAAIETASGTKEYPDAMRGDIPALVDELVRAGERVFAVRSTGSSLEDAYLDAVSGEQG